MVTIILLFVAMCFSLIGIDFGGSLIKYVKIEDGDIELGVVPLKNIDDLRTEIEKRHDFDIVLTGGGSYKYTFLEHKNRLPEMQALFCGLKYFMALQPGQFFTYGHNVTKIPIVCRNDSLLVNIGSGISIVKIGEFDYSRLGGTTIGGGTFLGMGRLISQETDAEKMFEMASKGDNFKVDLSIKDIYGDYDTSKMLGLDNKLVASSFGKVALTDPKAFEKRDALSSLLSLIVNNICLMAISHAEKHNIGQIVFSGCFSGKAVVQERIAYCFTALKKTTITPIFIKNSGHLGAFGCVSRILSEKKDISSFGKTHLNENH